MSRSTYHTRPICQTRLNCKTSVQETGGSRRNSEKRGSPPRKRCSSSAQSRQIDKPNAVFFAEVRSWVNASLVPQRGVALTLFWDKEVTPLYLAIQYALCPPSRVRERDSRESCTFFSTPRLDSSSFPFFHVCRLQVSGL